MWPLNCILNSVGNSAAFDAGSLDDEAPPEVGSDQLAARSPRVTTNRTIGAKALEEIQVPLSSYERQLWFGQLYDKVEAIKQLQAETTTGREAMLPAILDRAFRGEPL